MNAQSLKIIVLGYIVRGPLAGFAWHHAQYVMGLSRLGHDVYYLEDSEDYPACYDPTRHITNADPSYGLEFIARTFERLGLEPRWAYYDAHTSRWFGPCAEKVGAICDSAHVILNLSGVNPLRSWVGGIPKRVFVDTDPVFTQIRHLTDRSAHDLVAQHTAYFSFGENIGSEDCQIPDDGFRWQPTRQPIVLDAWPQAEPRPQGRYTTVMQWDSYQTTEYKGRYYGMKSLTLEPYLDLPSKTRVELELALGSANAPRELLREHGWKIINPLVISRTVDSYRKYLQASKAEFSVAKHGYVTTRSGWFSERSACYLASGRPVIMQDTGFTPILKTDAGLFPFHSMEGACAAIEAVEADYKRQCDAAREIGQDYFDSDVVLGNLIDAIFACSTPST